MKETKIENWCQTVLTGNKVYQLLDEIDADFARREREQGCRWCSGKLHSARYERKPRGGPKRNEVVYRWSFCCEKEGCRKRHTPASVRFLGRKVYESVVVVLISALSHGLNPGAVEILRSALGIDRRTLLRWRQWWRETFVQSRFWKAARARFSPPTCEATLPHSLCERFGWEELEKLLKLMKWLTPLSVSTSKTRPM